MGGDKEHQTIEARYAPYIEDYHKSQLLRYVTFQERLLHYWENSGPGIEWPADPFDGIADIDIEAAFFGAGYTISSFPSMYDMFGKFMAGLDVEVLYDQEFQDTINGAVVHDAITAEAERETEELEEQVLPRFECGMRDINAVMSSTFVVGKAMLETARTRNVAKFSADFKARLMPVVADRWARHLEWNRGVIDMYGQLMKLYISAEMDTQNHNTEMESKHLLWPYTVLNYTMNALGVMQGAKNETTEVAGASKAAKAIGGAMSGAAAGAMVGAEIGSGGGPIGAAIGGLVGLAAGLL